ncbi:MAG: MMPL family transporter [Planctomycetes bacterium]|nr:MMPL family transporter [Planctomycetota bacterium]
MKSRPSTAVAEDDEAAVARQLLVIVVVAAGAAGHEPARRPVPDHVLDPVACADRLGVRADREELAALEPRPEGEVEVDPAAEEPAAEVSRVRILVVELDESELRALGFVVVDLGDDDRLERAAGGERAEAGGGDPQEHWVRRLHGPVPRRTRPRGSCIVPGRGARSYRPAAQPDPRRRPAGHRPSGRVDWPPSPPNDPRSTLYSSRDDFPLLRLPYRLAVARPRCVIAAVLLATLAVAPGLRRLEVRTDGRELAPRDAPEVLFDASVRAEFGLEDPVVVLIRSERPEGIFHPAPLRLVEELTRELAALPGVGSSGVMSLATEPGDRHRPGSLDYLRLLEPLPQTREECERLRGDLEALRVYTGTIASRDGKAAAIFIGVAAGADRAALIRDIQTAAEARSTAEDRIDVVGAPVAEVLLGTHILEDLGVPAALLGGRSRGGGRDRDATGSFYGLKRLIGERVGLLPLALGVMVAVFLAFFRRPAAALMPLCEVGACLLFVFGLMGLTGVPVYLTIAVMPVILTLTGVTDEVHLLSRFRDLAIPMHGQPRSAVVLATLDEMLLPVLKTAFTTAVGFASFAFSPLPPVRAFGVFTSAGVIYCFLFSSTVVPAVLVLARPGWFEGAPGAPGNASALGGGLAGAVARTAEPAARRPRLVLGAALLLVLASCHGLSLLRVQDSWIDSFDPESAFHRATRYFNEQFHGAHVLVLRARTGSETLRAEVPAGDVDHHEVLLPADLVEDPALLVGRPIRIAPSSPAASSSVPPSPAPPAPTGASGPPRSWSSWIEGAAVEGGRLRVTTPRTLGSLRLLLGADEDRRGTLVCEIGARRLMALPVLRRLEELEAFLEGRREEAVGGVLGPVDYLTTTRFIMKRRAPGLRALPEDPWEIEVLWRNYGAIRGERRLRELVDERFEKALLTVYLRDANYIGTARLMAAVRAHEAERLRPLGIEVGFAGDVAVSQALIDGIVTTQTQSLLLSMAGIFAVTALVGRSVLWGLACLVPCAVAVLLNFALMGWLGVPLGVATSMFSSMALGIGVDYAIHLLERYRVGREAGLEREAALTESLGVTGPAVVTDCLAVALGFSVLLLSQVPANARLGGVLVLSLLSSLAATLVVLPALLRLGLARPGQRKASATP